MKKDAVYWVIVITAATSFLYGTGTAATFVCGFSISFFYMLLTAGLWQYAAIPMLILFLYKKSHPKFLAAPAVLLILFFWPLLESATGLTLGTLIRGFLWMILSFALTFYSLYLLSNGEGVERSSAKS